MRRFFLILCLFILFGGQTAGAGTIVDDSGQEVRLAKPARRVVPLYGGFSEIIVALQAGDTLVARTDGDETVKRLPRVGNHMRPNMERIAALSPDLVIILEGRQEAGTQAQALRRQGIAVARFQIGSFHELFSCMERLGVLLGREKEAAKLVSGMDERLEAVTRRIEGKKRPTVFFEVRYPNLLAAGDSNMAADVIRKAGGRFVMEGYPEKLVRLSEETLLIKDPDIYLMQLGPMNKDPQPVAERPHFEILKAVRKGRVYSVDETLYSRPGPRSIEAVEALAGIIEDWQDGR